MLVLCYCRASTTQFHQSTFCKSLYCIREVSNLGVGLTPHFSSLQDICTRCSFFGARSNQICSDIHNCCQWYILHFWVVRVDTWSNQHPLLHCKPSRRILLDTPFAARSTTDIARKSAQVSGLNSVRKVSRVIHVVPKFEIARLWEMDMQVFHEYLLHLIHHPGNLETRLDQ